MLNTLPIRDSVEAKPPTELYIETTNRCNLTCRTCPQYYGMPEASADLRAQDVQRLLEQAPGIQRVVLHGIGEPLLNPELPAIIRAVKAKGAYALFNSNGLLLRGRLVEPLIESGLDELRVSVDSAEPETYQRIRGIDGLGRIFENLEAFAAAKRRLDAPTPAVSLWITGMKSNVLELPALIRRAASIGINEVYLQRLVYSERGLATAEEAIFKRSESAELAAVDEAQRLAVELGVRLRGAGHASSAEVLLDPEADLSYEDCYRPWSLMYVTANGNVLPCCIAPFTTVPYGDIVLGNVFENSLAEIWNGSAYRSWRFRMLSDTPPEACKGCGSTWSL